MNQETIRFHRLASGEFLEAYHWYLERSEQAAKNFVSAVDHCLFRIADHSQRLPKAGRTYQYVRVNGFPYVVIFRKIEAADFQFFIFAVSHTSRKTGYWRSRRAID